MNESIAEVEMDLNLGYISSDLSDLTDSEVEDDEQVESVSLVEVKSKSKSELGGKL